MPLNLLSDPWIPTFRNGDPATIRPDQIAEPGITRLAWERADFNLACLELLIGLVSMATPPEGRCRMAFTTRPVRCRKASGGFGAVRISL